MERCSCGSFGCGRVPVPTFDEWLAEGRRLRAVVRDAGTPEAWDALTAYNAKGWRPVFIRRA